MRDDPDESARRVARQAGIRVERDAALNARQFCNIATDRGETRVAGPAHESDKLEQLSTLPLPPHPTSLNRVPESTSMKQEESLRPLPMSLVQRANRFPRRGQQLLIFRHLLGRRVGEISQ